MKDDDQFEDTNEEHSDSRLILISLGALIGGAVSVILLRSERIIMAFRQRRLQAQASVEGEPSQGEYASLAGAMAELRHRQGQSRGGGDLAAED